MAKKKQKKQKKAEAVTAVQPQPSEEILAALSGQPTGMETVTNEDLLVPRISILQLVSPQLRKTDAKYIEGAQAGEICNTAMSYTYGKEIEFLPMVFRKLWLVWPAERGGNNFPKVFDDPKITIQANWKVINGANQLALEDGSIVQETSNISGYVMNGDVPEDGGFISFHSTAIRACRQILMMSKKIKIYNAKAQRIEAPLWYSTYKMSSSLESNDKGEWYGWSVKPGRHLVELEGGLNTVQDIIGMVQFMDTNKPTEKALIEASATDTSRSVADVPF